MRFNRMRHCAGASGLVLAWTLAGAAAAQSATPPVTPSASSDETSVAELVVTGTNIRGAAPVGSSAVSVNREQMEASGAVTATQMLQQIPQVFNLGVSETSRGQSGGSSNISYGSAINIRGIGPYATLTLIDGQRVVPQGGGGQGVDPSIIPTIMLDRVEIVADGASAVYGSDAIAGVANLILRRHFKGAAALVHYGTGDHYDERQVGLLFGRSNDIASFTIGYENAYHSAINGADRDFYRANLTAQGGGDFRSNLCNPGNLTVAGVKYAVPAGGVTQATAGSLVAGSVNLCDIQKTGDLIPEQSHNAFAGTFDLDISSKLHLTSDVLVADRKFRLRPSPVTASLTIPSASPDFVLPGAAAASETVTYAFTGWPIDVARGYNRSWNAAFGLDYQLPHDFKISGNFGVGGANDGSLTRLGINTTAVAAAILAGTFNPLNPASNPALIVNGNDAVFDSTTKNRLEVYGVKIDGPLFNLSGGPLRIALGYDGQHLKTKLGIFQGVPASPDVYADTFRPFQRKVDSGFAEALAPLIGPETGVPFMRRLDIDAAVRYDVYGDIGAKTTNPKYGVNWTIVDGLVVKASYGTSFRAPILPQIYGNSNGLFVQPYQDPTCTCTIQGVARSGGNLNLQPETAITRSYGVDWRPSFLSGLRLSVNRFDIKYSNQVLAVLSNLSLLGSESQYAGTGIIVRNPAPAFIAGLNLPVLRGGPLPNPLLLFVDGRSQNLGVSVTKGYDFQASYAFKAGQAGDFMVGVNGTYFTDYKLAVTPLAPRIDLLNTIFNPLKLRTRSYVSWNDGPVGAWLFVNHTNAYTNTVPTVRQKVAAYTTIDARLAYTLKGDAGLAKDVTISIEALNLLDKDPPFANIAESPNGGGGFDPTAANPIGRVVSVSVGKKW